MMIISHADDEEKLCCSIVFKWFSHCVHLFELQMKKIAENSPSDVQLPEFDNSWHKLLTEVRWHLLLPPAVISYLFIIGGNCYESPENFLLCQLRTRIRCDRIILISCHKWFVFAFVMFKVRTVFCLSFASCMANLFDKFTCWNITSLVFRMGRWSGTAKCCRWKALADGELKQTGLRQLITLAHIGHMLISTHIWWWVERWAYEKAAAHGGWKCHSSHNGHQQ